MKDLQDIVREPKNKGVALALDGHSKLVSDWVRSMTAPFERPAGDLRVVASRPKT